MSRIRANQITNQAADGAPVVQNGLVVTGVTTSTNVSVAQSVTATNFYGSGVGLVGVASTDYIVTGTAATFTGPVEFQNKVDVSDGDFNLPVGNTLARNNFANIGDFRYNSTTGKLELYNGASWENVGNSQPLINNISPTSYSGAAGTSITVIGNNFESGCNVHFISSVNGSSTAAGSVAFVNSGILTATAPTLTVAGEPYGVRVTNPDGGMTLLEAALDAGSAPTWSTPAGLLRDGIQKNNALPTGASGIAVTATDPEGQTVTYSEVTSVLTSNADTPNSTMSCFLNSTTGIITGTAPNVSADTTYNFTIRASDSLGNNTDRNFSIGIMAASNPVYFFRGSAHGGTGGSDTSVVTSWGTSGNNSNSSGGGNANNDRLYVYKTGNSGVGVGIHQYLSSNNTATIPADHDKFRVVCTSQNTVSHSTHFGWATNGASGTSNYYVSGATKYSPGVGTHDYDIPASMVGNAYHFTIGVNCGQNCNNYTTVTLACSYNSANPP